MTSDITINPAPATVKNTDPYHTIDGSRFQQLAEDNTQLREAVEALQRQADNQLAGAANDADRYRQVTEEATRLRDTVVAQADTITALEEEAKDREAAIEQLYGVADVFLHAALRERRR